MKCKVCSRETQLQLETGYCELHQRAYENLQTKYETWKKASNIDWKTYLQQISKNPFTGIWAKEVAETLLKDEEQRIG